MYRLRLAILVFALALIAIWAFRTPLRQWAFEASGEEELMGQVRGLFQYATNWTRPLPDTRPNAQITTFGASPFGVNTFLEQEVEPAKRERQMQMIAGAGFHWIRQEFPWADIEITAKGDFLDRRNDPNGVDAWNKYDNIVDLAQKYNLQVMARLTSPPEWSRHDGQARGAFAPPDNIFDYADFVEAVVRRYKGRLRFLQIWNEPNLTPEWGNCSTCGVDPAAYTKLLCASIRPGQVR
jgi:beta-glucosidase/6-phospho-beta-glucosidase/beta-galactosidase